MYTFSVGTKHSVHPEILFTKILGCEYMCIDTYSTCVSIPIVCNLDTIALKLRTQNDIFAARLGTNSSTLRTAILARVRSIAKLSSLSLVTSFSNYSFSGNFVRNRLQENMEEISSFTQSTFSLPVNDDIKNLP